MGLQFGMKAIQSGKRIATGNNEPTLVANSTKARFTIAGIVSRTMGLVSGDYVQFISNIPSIDMAIAERDSEIVAWCEENGLGSYGDPLLVKGLPERAARAEEGGLNGPLAASEGSGNFADALAVPVAPQEKPPGILGLCAQKIIECALQLLHHGGLLRAVLCQRQAGLQLLIGLRQCGLALLRVMIGIAVER